MIQECDTATQKSGLNETNDQAANQAARQPASRALWYVAPQQAEIREVALGPLAPGHCRIRTHASAISRGTESLIFNNQVPATEFDRMGSPLMLGKLPYPVAYGYCNVGEVIAGPSTDLANGNDPNDWNHRNDETDSTSWLGQMVFALAPHQTVFDAPLTLLAKVPNNLPPARALLAANMETALNAVWMGKPGPADRIGIVGAGVVGLLVASLCQRLPGAEVCVIDPDASKREICNALGLNHQTGVSRTGHCDVVFHASGHPAGLQTALSLAGNEASVVELSWYGAKPVTVELGGSFHSQQLRLQSCQVGHVEPSHAPRWTHQRRLQAALELLADPRFDALLEPAMEFDELPSRLPSLFTGTAQSLCQIIRYPLGA